MYGNLAKSNKPFSLYNLVSINAKIDTLDKLLDEILFSTLHLNWSSSNRFDKELSEEKKYLYAQSQLERIEIMEAREEKIRSGLNLLQKRYPNNVKLFQWEKNNLYSNLLTYSPIYLRFKSYLNAYIKENNNIWQEYSKLISKINWDILSKNGIADLNDGSRIVEFIDYDPAATLMKIRVIIEKMINYVYKKEFGDVRDKLGSKMYKLNEKGLFPPILYTFLNFLRLSGNLGVHELSSSIGDKKDVEAIIPVFTRVVEWFLNRINLY